MLVKADGAPAALLKTTQLITNRNGKDVFVVTKKDADGSDYKVLGFSDKSSTVLYEEEGEYDDMLYSDDLPPDLEAGTLVAKAVNLSKEESYEGFDLTVQLEMNLMVVGLKKNIENLRRLQDITLSLDCPNGDALITLINFKIKDSLKGQVPFVTVQFMEDSFNGANNFEQLSPYLRKLGMFEAFSGRSQETGFTDPSLVDYERLLEAIQELTREGR